MSVDIQSFKKLITEQKTVLGRFAQLLTDVLAAARAKDGVRIASLSSQLVETQNTASKLDEQLHAEALTAAQQLGIPIEQFKLSLLDKDKSYLALVDETRKLANETARLAAEAAGVLSANISIISDTIRILESIDARAVGYGASATSAPRPLSKLIDHSA